MSPTTLPKDFVWGMATAAQQIEGGAANGGRGPSIWDEFARTQGDKIRDGSNPSVACDSFHRYKEDIALLKHMKVHGYRFSISWPRIIPLGGRGDPVNPEGIKYYNDLIDELLAAGIKPYITLYHWDLPQNLMDRYTGWLNKEESTADFLHYSQVCFDAFGDRCKFWLTFNEPWVVAVFGWMKGNTAPGRSSARPYSEAGDSATEPWIVGHNLMVAHAHVAKLYHTKYAKKQGGLIGITLNGDWAEPWDDSPESIAATERKNAAAIGWWADPIYLGHESAPLRAMIGDRLPTFTSEEWELLKDSSDFYGCNFYTMNLVKDGGVDEGQGRTELTWVRKDGGVVGEACEANWLISAPEYFRKHLKYLYDRYKKPIYMTESGFAVKGEADMSLADALYDVERAKYHTDHLNIILKSIHEDHVDIRGWFGWSLMDNWEWQDGYGTRFGVVYVDYATGTRTPKYSSKAITEWFDEHLAKEKEEEKRGWCVSA